MVTMDDADRRAIIDLTIAYCWALDGRDWDRLDDIFTPDATATLGPEVVGVEAIKRRVREALEPLAVSQHMVSTHEVRVDADRATARCYLLAQHIRDPSGAPQFVVAGRYADELVRTEVGWRIKRRVLEVLWTDGDPAVLQPDA